MQTEEAAKETFEVSEKEAAGAVPLPTREEAKAQGLTSEELDKAEKRGMIATKEDVDKKAVDDKAKTDADAKIKADEAGKATEEEKRADGKQRSAIPDFTFKTPEQEKAFLDAFGSGTPQRAMYFRMKNERQSRQAAEQERDKERKAREDLEARIRTLEAGKKTQELDDLGNPIDPDDKPLTLKQLREIQKAEGEAIEKRQKENESRARTVSEAQQNQEEYARAIYPDFDDTVTKASEVIKNLDKLVPERWKQAKVIKMIRDLQVAAAQADKIDLDEYHASMIAYEIGQFHPDYGKNAEQEKDGDASESGKTKDPKKANGGLTPEQMKRIEDNTHRRASSASVTGGGGKRTISSDDVDAAALDKMSYTERQKFRQKHPDRYAKLLRG